MHYCNFVASNNGNYYYYIISCQEYFFKRYAFANDIEYEEVGEYTHNNLMRGLLIKTKGDITCK